MTNRKENLNRKSLYNLNLLLQLIPDIVFRIFKNRIFLINNSEILRNLVLAINGKKFKEVMPKLFADLFKINIQKTFDEGKIQEFEFKLKIPKRGLRDYEILVLPITENEATVIMRDITTRKRNQNALFESELKFRSLLNTTPDAMLIVNEKGIIVYTNKQSDLFFKYTQKELLGKNFDILIPERYRKKHRIEQAGYIKNPRFRPMGLNNELFTLCKDGSEIPVEISLSYLRFESELNVICAIRDISERKQIQNEIIKQREQLHSLNNHLQEIIENERTNIAREIHDELGQLLTALNMDISWINIKLNKYRKENKKLISKKLVSINELIHNLIESVRKISTELRPGILDDLGLIPAIEWQTSDFQNRSGIKCRITSTIKDFDISKDKVTAIFRIFQEILTNIARHSSAKNVFIKLYIRKGMLLLNVHDDGRGITQNEISGFKSLGILGMNERAYSVGGKIEFKKVKKGTKLILQVPL